MLEDLMKNNKLEYIHIYAYKDYNIVKPMILSRNIENPRYFYVTNGMNRVDLTLDIT